MKIRKDDYQDILEYLIKKRWEGEEFVAFLDSPSPVSKEELFTFCEQYDVREFCYEMSTDIDFYNFISLRSAYKAMQEAIENDKLLIERDGLIDVSLMVAVRYERLEKEQLNNNQNSEVMNQKNFEYLRDQVKYTGFGEGLENDLKQKIQEGNPEFKLAYETKYGNDSVNATLNFSQSKQSDMYFFNSYQVNVQKENSAETMEQTFYINKGNNITLKEAYNLMEGRSVNKDLTNKEGQVYNAWVQMDFKQSDDNGNFKLKHYHENYGYDLEAVLSKHPIRELGNEEYKSNLMDSLKKGNLQSATFQINGADQKQYIEANPQFKTINIYDSSMQRVDNRQSKKEQQSEGEGQSVKQDGKKEKQTPAEDDGPEIPKASNKRKKRQSIN
ncbi:hypothetical protein SAMN05444410_103141 [Hydrobacter penzbergensis]|uniref:DUF3945 domain-containing protein n=1 Tax=Hydrobacter penzbergensis TaxID=1235997 RepID=A0A8X8IET2_9BACT|nr:hypothetical protein [Hydrobacter penzbergensis]SDW50393.1 hypothetical protein SAMN05444410_103141 [Hydrobacter penzbergensis]